MTMAGADGESGRDRLRPDARREAARRSMPATAEGELADIAEGCRGRQAARASAMCCPRKARGAGFPRRRLRPFAISCAIARAASREIARPAVATHGRGAACTICARKCGAAVRGRHVAKPSSMTRAARAEARGAFPDRARRPCRRCRCGDDGRPAERTGRRLRRGRDRFPAARRASTAASSNCPIPSNPARAPAGSCSAWASSARSS